MRGGRVARALLAAALAAGAAQAEESQRAELDRLGAEVGAFADPFAASRASLDSHLCSLREAKHERGETPLGRHGLPATLALIARISAPTLVLSQLEWDAARDDRPASLILGFGDATQEGVRAFVEGLTKAGSCDVPTIQKTAEGFKAFCLVKTPRDPARAEESRELGRRPAPESVESSQQRLPFLRQISAQRALAERDLALIIRQLAELEKQLPDQVAIEDLSDKFEQITANTGAVIANFQVGAPRRSGSLEAIPVKVEATGSYHSLARFLESTLALARIFRIDRLALRNPRSRNGEISLDAAIGLETFSVPVGTPQRCSSTFREASDENVSAEEVAPYSPEGLRDPFAPPRPLFAGSQRKLSGTECRRAGEAGSAPPPHFQLDDLQVVYTHASPQHPCAMLIDSNGGCHTVRPGDRVGSSEGGRVKSIDGTRLVISEIRHQGNGRIFLSPIEMLIPKSSSPPLWFCKK